MSTEGLAGLHACLSNDACRGAVSEQSFLTTCYKQTKMNVQRGEQMLEVAMLAARHRGNMRRKSSCSVVGDIWAFLKHCGLVSKRVQGVNATDNSNEFDMYEHTIYQGWVFNHCLCTFSCRHKKTMKSNQTCTLGWFVVGRLGQTNLQCCISDHPFF